MNNFSDIEIIISALIALLVITLIFMFIYIKNKIFSVSSRINKSHNILDKKINTIYDTEKENLLKQFNEEINSKKDSFDKHVKESFQKVGDDIIFEFCVDKELGKSEFISLKTAVENQKDKYSGLLNMVLSKHALENVEFRKLLDDFRELNETYDSYTQEINTKITEINEVIDINSNNSQRGQELAKDFENRITTLEDLTFNEVIDDGIDDEYSFVGSIESETSSGGIGDAEMQDIKSNLQLPPKPKKDNSIASRYRNM
jgi:uncharacterized protein YoxC